MDLWYTFAESFRLRKSVSQAVKLGVDIGIDRLDDLVAGFGPADDDGKVRAWESPRTRSAADPNS